jgi:hypothetical protein
VARPRTSSSLASEPMPNVNTECPKAPGLVSHGRNEDDKQLQGQEVSTSGVAGLLKHKSDAL